MIVSKTPVVDEVPREAVVSQTVAVPVRESETLETATPVVTQVDEDDLKLDALYNSASNLEAEFAGLARRGTAALTAGQIGAFNSVVKMARILLPKSIALRDDVDEIDATTRPADAHQALHVTLVPTLHNALPEPLYDRHG